MTAMRASGADLTPSAASLRTDLELARQEITDLRADRERLRDGMRRQLGRDLDSLDAADLTTRLGELARHNQQLTEQHRPIAAKTRGYKHGSPRSRTTSPPPAPACAT